MNTLYTSRTLPLAKVSIQDSFWSHYEKLIRDVVLPYQWDALNDRIPDAEPSCAIQNFRVAAGEVKGEFHGMVFQDSDVAKWLEAVGYLLTTQPDAELERIADGIIDTISKAQQKDGYLNTYFTLKEPNNKWTNLAECHELYCAGHMIEAAVAYYKATGKRKLLDVACLLSDHIDTVFGTETDKIHGYDGHQEIELALVKLFHVTGNEKYLKLSKYFLDERGKTPHFYDEEYVKRGRTNHWPLLNVIEKKEYSQAHVPVREQDKAVGHAVRLVYMSTGMADVAAETGDKELLEACRKLWHNMVSKSMYITGGIGSQVHGEAFSLDYDLPNDSIYAETCASIGLIFFAQRMLQIEAKSEYADVLERALYNTVIAGMSQDGKHFFYVNPLEVWPEAHGKNANFDHVKPQRQRWFGCACCPPNVARLIASLGQYIYTVNDTTLYTHLYIGGEAKVEFNGKPVKIIQHSELPWNGKTSFSIFPEQSVDFALALRVPWWCEDIEIKVNGELVNTAAVMMDGYAHIHRTWVEGDQVEVSLSMPILSIRSNPLVRENVGKVVLQRGPLVYCLEEADNGSNLQEVYLLQEGTRSVHFDNDLLQGIQVISADAERIDHETWGTQLYQKNVTVESRPAVVKLIPYFAWANRTVGEMRVWLNEKS
ncbi:MAG: beta-L-arabinofuranosidase domain-containing protein [Paenibacillaceae bacterium]